MILHMLIVMLAGWIQRHQQQVISYLIEENRVLKAHLGGRQLCLTDPERRRLAALAHPLGRTRLKEVATLATPDTLLRWDQHLIAQKFDGSTQPRQLGRPRVAEEVEQVVLRMAHRHGGGTCMLLSLHDLPTELRLALGAAPGSGVVFLAPMEDEVIPGRCAVLAMTLNPRVRIVAGALVLVRVRTHEPQPLTGTATPLHKPPDALAGWSETSGLVPGQYALHATMRGARGEVDTAVLPVTVQPVQRLGRATCRITEAVGSLPGWGVA